MSPLKGYKQTEEHIRKLSEARTGHKRSEEMKEKISEALKGRKPAMGFLGKCHSEETKRKLSKIKKGNNNPNWKGGKVKDGNDYIRVLSPDHPYIDIKGYVFEHRLVMEAHLGRTLLPTEVVHHINGINDDNRIENLMLFNNVGEHTTLHNKQRNRRV